MRNPFRWAYAGLTLAALALVAVVALWPRSPQTPTRARPPAPVRAERHPAIPSVLWGQAIYRTEGLKVALGPAADRRRRYELGSRTSDLAGVTVLVSNDLGRTYLPLHGSPIGRCGFHWQGWGVNAIMASRDCVPYWAHDERGAHAKYWLRVENLVPFARVVLLKYGP